MDTLRLDYSQAHFAKAQGSPFTTKPLQHLLQYDGITKFGDMVYKGRAQLEDLPIDDST